MKRLLTVLVAIVAFGVINQGSAGASVVDGRTHLVSTVPTGDCPVAVAVNALTGYAYVANSSSNDVTVIYGYGEGKKRTTVSAGPTPWSIAVNPRTNLIYVCNLRDAPSNGRSAHPAALKDSSTRRLPFARS